jgi:hypothetical protein
MFSGMKQGKILNQQRPSCGEVMNRNGFYLIRDGKPLCSRVEEKDMLQSEVRDSILYGRRQTGRVGPLAFNPTQFASTP